MSDPFLVHVLCMIVAWLVLLPTGGLVARFCKVTPQQDWPRTLDNPFWWWAHRVLQYAGIGCALAGLGVAFRAQGSLDIGLLHVQAGLLLLGLAVLQVISAWFRGSKGGPTDRGADRSRPETWRGDHYDMTARRRGFEAWHKTTGWVCIAAAPLVIVLGLQLYGWPSALCGLCLALVVAQLAGLAALARSSRRVGTYQAIWGPDASHPGNHP